MISPRTPYASNFAKKLSKEMKVKHITSKDLAERMGESEDHISWLRRFATSEEEIRPYYDMLNNIKQKDGHKDKRVYVTLPEDLHLYVKSTGNLSGKINDVLVRYLEKIDAHDHGSVEEVKRVQVGEDD